MSELREKLEKELQNLNSILQHLKEDPTTYPKGTLRVSSISAKRKKPRFYHCLDGKTTYLSNADSTLPQKLCQHKYNERVRALAEKRARQLSALLSDYQDGEIDAIYLRQHPARKALIQPVQPVYQEVLSEWLAVPYTKLPIAEDVPRYQTDQGEYVRSKSELIIANYLHQLGIPYRYEKPLCLDECTTVHPDFTFLSQRTMQEVYWEHLGMMNDAQYSESALRKINGYIAHDITPGDRLILSFESSGSPLQMAQIRSLIRFHFPEYL